MISGQITIRNRSDAHRGFTLIELLTVVGIIAILVSVLAVGVSRGFGTARDASTQSLLNSIGMGIEAFKTDLGSAPPLVVPHLLGAGRQELVTPESFQASGLSTEANVGEVLARPDVRYHSEFTIAAYLLGVGDFNNDDNLGLNTAAVAGDLDFLDDGVAGQGIKSPGRSRAWKNPDTLTGAIGHNPPLSGRTFGPYIDGVSLGGDGTKQSRILELDEELGMYRILDAWDNPIRYYKGWPVVGDADSFEPRQPTVEHIPMPLRTWASAGLELELGDGGVDPNPSSNVEVLGETRAMLMADYALVSSGGNASEWTMRNDYAPGSPTEPVSPFGDLLSALGTEVPFVMKDSIDLVLIPEAYKETLERMLESNLRYTP